MKYIDKQSQDLLGQIVHSYNNFLSGAIGFTELALLDCQQNEVSERLDLSIQSGRNAVDFGNQLLSAVGRLQVKMEKSDLAKMLEKLANTYGFELQIDKKQTDYVTISNSDWLYQCLASIFEFCNAFNAQSKIDCALSKENIGIAEVTDTEVLRLTIKPIAIHFTREQSSRLFEPFYTSRHLLGSKDVGLAMVAGFVHQMKGKMRWTNQKGFILDLPLAKGYFPASQEA